MQFGRSSRRSIRYSILIGVLAGSVFSGSGAFAVDPIGIATQIELEAIGQDELKPINGDYFLAFSETELALTAPTNSTYILGVFTGTLDGRGKTLSGLTAPLFDVIGAAENTLGPITEAPIDTVEVKDLNLVTDSEVGVSGGGTLANTIATGGTVNSVSSTGNVTGIDFDLDPDTSIYTGTVYVGGLVGENSGTIFDSHASGNVVGTDANGGAVGGLVGLSMGNISDSTFTGAVTGERYVGGLVGGTGAPTISNSSASGTVTGIDGGQGYIGGLVGGGSMTITDSHADVVVTGGVGNRAIGGLLGWGDVSVSIINSYSTGNVFGTGDYVGGLVGYTYGSISNSYTRVSGDVTGNSYVGGLVGYAGGEVSNSYASISGNVNGNERVGGLVGNAAGVISNSYSSLTGNVNGTGNSVGGLAGLAGDNVENSYSIVGGEVSGNYSVGGLVGSADYDISDSYATGSVSGIRYVGGLAGYLTRNISNSYATGSVMGTDSVGGLVGFAWSDFYNPPGDQSNIFNSYATGSVTGNLNIGGLVGFARGSIENSYAHGNVVGNNFVGGFVGVFVNPFSNISNSYASGKSSANVGDLNESAVGGFAGGACTGCTISHSYSTGLVSTPAGFVDRFLGSQYATVNNSCAGEIGASGNFICGVDPRRSVNEVLVPYWAINDDFDYTTVGLLSPAGVLGASFATDVCLNNTNPHLVSLLESYESSCNGGGGTPPPTTPTHERIEREFREVVETRTLEKIEKLDGFKKDATVTKDAAIAFVEPTEKIEVAKVKAVEVSATSNVRVNAKAGEALQISLKSGSKEPVELWVKSPDGKWLLAGVITFDKDGKAILPPLKFKNVGNYSLVLSKPTADSAKGSAPLNQSGSVLVAVN